MDDPVTVRMREPVEDLRRDLEHGGVVQLTRPEPIAERSSWHVLVRDVDVLLIAGERVGAQAMRVAQPRGRRGLPLRARVRLPLARDDLERNIEAVSLVAGDPD